MELPLQRSRAVWSGSVRIFCLLLTLFGGFKTPLELARGQILVLLS